jgi:hypothetical protein
MQYKSTRKKKRQVDVLYIDLNVTSFGLLAHQSELNLLVHQREENNVLESKSILNFCSNNFSCWNIAEAFSR